MKPSEHWICLALVPLLISLPWNRTPEGPSEEVQLILTQPDYPFPVPELMVINIDSPRELPFNYRDSTQELQPGKLGNGTPIVDDGLARLRLSGSGQFCENQLGELREKLSGQTVTFIDLRSEPHGHINNMAISWGPPAVLPAGDHSTLEQDWLAAALATRSVTINAFALEGYSRPDQYEAISMKVDVRKVWTTGELVTRAGWRYVRIAVPPSAIPPDAAIDQFVSTYARQPEGGWTHIQCDSGLARTTTFMILADMLKNYTYVQPDITVARQHKLGGSNFLAAKNNAVLIAFFRDFHRYCWKAGPSFSLSWSNWRRRSAKGD